MFTIAHGNGLPPIECFSFAEVAAEIGCSVALLEAAIAETPTKRAGKPLQAREVRALVRERPAQMTTGFQALRLADYKRLAVEGHVTNEATELPGFEGLVLYDDAAHEFAGSGAEFAFLLSRLHIPVSPVKCLSRVGRNYAVQHLRWLAEETMPSSVKGGPASAAWRQQQRREQVAG